MIIDCDRIWTRLVTFVYKVRGTPRVTNDPPPVRIDAKVGRPD